MKKCPTCERTFDDSMKFCQTDGTPLVAVAENAAPDDAYKTTVGRQEDIAASIQPDPFKTMIGGSFNKDESGDPFADSGGFRSVENDVRDGRGNEKGNVGAQTGKRRRH
jgi:hypothetical protein